MIELRDVQVIRITQEEFKRLKTIHRPRVKRYESWLNLYISEAYPGKIYYVLLDEPTDDYYIILTTDDMTIMYTETVVDEDGVPYTREYRVYD